MKKIAIIILSAFVMIFLSSCENQTKYYQSSSTNQTYNSQIIFDSHQEISENSVDEHSSYYVLNTNTKKVHLPSCYYVQKISPKNYAVTDDLQSAIDNGYSKCQKCRPN